MLKHGIPLLLLASGVMFFAAGFLAPLTGGRGTDLPQIAEPRLPQIAGIEVRGGRAPAGGRLPESGENESRAAIVDAGGHQTSNAGHSGDHPVKNGEDSAHSVGVHATPEKDAREAGSHDDDGHASQEARGDGDEAYRRLAIGSLPKGDDQPWKIVRGLQLLQDDIALGRQSSIAAYREEIVRAGRVMINLAPKMWNQQRNLDAAAIYLLIGGNPALAETALSHTQLGGADRLPLEAAKAYSRKEVRDAEDAFKQLPFESLAPSARGQFALARSMIHAAHDTEFARQLLEEARRQSPGTLIEEAALRRLLRIAGDAEDVEAFGYYVRTYQDRFRNSGYFGDFVRNFVISLSMMPSTRQNELVEMLEALCATLPPAQQLPVVGNVAKRATVDGKTVLAQWASEKGLSLLGETSKFRAQFELYLGAAQVVEPDKTAQAIAMLEEINRDDLDRPNRLLLDAVLELSRRITGEPVNMQKVKALLGREQQVFPGDDPVMPVSENELQDEVRAHRAVMRMKRLAGELETYGLGY